MGSVVDRLKGRKATHTVDDLRPADESNAHLPHSGSLEGSNQKVESNPDEVTKEAQLGVQKAEAAALVWSKKAVYMIYAWIWICYFMLSLHEYIGSNVLYYAYSKFDSAPQVTTAFILANIIGGVLKLPIGKVLGLWGRAEGLMAFLVVYLVGMILLASCNGPKSFAAGYVFYWVGFDAIYLILEIFIADTSGMRNRAFAFGFSTTPYLCTAFTGPLAAASFLKIGGWRWAYGAFCLIQPVVFAPLIMTFKYYENKARKEGILVRQSSGRNILQSIIHYVHEFDVIGALILMAAFILFLLPFSLATYGRAQYRDASFIAEVVVGFCLFFVFAAWENWFARTHFIPYQLLRDRTVLGACFVAAILYFSFYCWDSYFYYFVMVVYNLDVKLTGYMTSIYTIGSCFWSPIFGLWIRGVKEFKYSCLFFAVPLMLLGAGLMVHFRGQDADIGYVIMCQIFIAFSGAMLVIGEQMAGMCASDRDNIPIILSMIGLFSSVGGAIGDAVAAAIYTNTFPQGLRRALPMSAQSEWESIYLGGYSAQLVYAPGTEVRDAINFAWGYTQKYEAIAATCLVILLIPSILMWRHYRVDKEQNKGVTL
ncbi:MFS general substrate transporter [Penicillium sp. IBT 16267x]|nr:MFS general substrate transporter [Penicillium sp. IBT 16267x]